jgi:rSAM/selenodomain-associated transferase 1
MDEILLIFVKNPQLGKVKTRLASTIGEEAAMNIYRRLLDFTRKTAAGVDCRRWVCYSDFIPAAAEWPDAVFEKHMQSGADLGERMSKAFQAAFQSGASKVVIIGSDCPQITPEILHDAFQALDTRDFVIGPSTDGGYYLLGMRRFEPRVFEEIVWSTDTVCLLTQERIRETGGSFHLLPILTDIDTEEDLRAVGVW